jgi:hypothetical protein
VYWTIADLINVITTNEKSGISATQTIKRLPHGLHIYVGKKDTTEQTMIDAALSMLIKNMPRCRVKAMLKERFNLSRRTIDRILIKAVNLQLERLG